MTLCIFRPQRTYDAQFLFELNDVYGLMKKLNEAVAAMSEDGLSSTSYYVGALTALKVLFDGARDGGKVDKWTDFMASFESALEELEGE